MKLRAFGQAGLLESRTGPFELWRQVHQSDLQLRQTREAQLRPFAGVAAYIQQARGRIGAHALA